MNSAWLRYIMLFFFGTETILNVLKEQLLKQFPNDSIQYGIEVLTTISLVWVPIAIFLAVRAIIEYEDQLQTIGMMLFVGGLAEVPYDFLHFGKISWTLQNPLIGMGVFILLLAICNKIFERFQWFGFIALAVSMLLMIPIGIYGHIQYFPYIIILGGIYYAQYWLEEYLEFVWIKVIVMFLIMGVMFITNSLSKEPMNYSFIGAIFPSFYNGEWGFFNRYEPYIGYLAIIGTALVMTFLKG